MNATDTIKRVKYRTLLDFFRSEYLVSLDKRIAEILLKNGYRVRSLNDFYLGIVKTKWEYRYMFEGPGFRGKKINREVVKNRGVLIPVFVKISYNYRLTDEWKIPLGDFHTNGVVIDLSREHIVYPGMLQSSQICDMDFTEAVLTDDFHRRMGLINPPVLSPLLTLFSDRFSNVYVHVESSHILKRVNHAISTFPELAGVLSPLVRACASVITDSELPEDVESIIYKGIFEGYSEMVLSIRFVFEDGFYSSLYLERGMVRKDGTWTCLEPYTEEDAWVNIVLDPYQWRGFSKMILRKGMEEHIRTEALKFEQMGEGYNRLIPIRVLRIIPEEVEPNGLWQTYYSWFDPHYHFHERILQTSPLELCYREGDYPMEIDSVNPLGTESARHFAEIIDREVEIKLSDSYGIHYHWKDVAFPIGMFWFDPNTKFFDSMMKYTFNNRQMVAGILRTKHDEVLCARLVTYYLCVADNLKSMFVDLVSNYFVNRAKLCNLLHDHTLDCSDNVRNLRVRFSDCKTLGARKFAVAKYVSELPWDKTTL